MCCINTKSPQFMILQFSAKELSPESTSPGKPWSTLVPKAFSPSIRSLKREQRTFLLLSRCKQQNTSPHWLADKAKHSQERAGLLAAVAIRSSTISNSKTRNNRHCLFRNKESGRLSDLTKVNQTGSEAMQESTAGFQAPGPPQQI